jgi:hypothetical protein
MLSKRVTVNVYVFVVPSCAVTSTGIVLLPTFRLTGDRLPLATAVPFTFTVALLSATTGSTRRLVTPYKLLNS